MSIKPTVMNSSFTIENVSDMQELMRGILSRHNGEQLIEIDLSEVDEFDGAGLQLLLAFSAAAKKMGSHIQLNNLPERVAAVLTRYNVSDHFVRREQV